MLSNPDTLGALGNTPCLWPGVHEVIDEVTDDCGNVGTCSFSLTVKDYAPPTASCQELTTVAIGSDDPLDCYDPANGCEFGGVTIVPASAFDSGSYDNCGNIKLTIRRAINRTATVSRASVAPTVRRHARMITARRNTK